MNTFNGINTWTHKEINKRQPFLQNSEVKWVLSAMREPVLKKSNYYRVPLVVLQGGSEGEREEGKNPCV